MPRRVLYDAASRPAAAAAGLLAGEYDVEAWTPEAMADSVVLTANPALAASGDRTLG